MAAPKSGWLVPLSLTVMVAFGVILYGFSIYITDHAAGSVFSKTVLSVGYGGSVFVGGLLAVPVGRYADRHGVRLIVGLGTALGSAGLVAFAVSQQPWQVITAWWLLLGPAQAMIYYEPAYVAINQWTQPGRQARTLAILTVIGGLAGIVFIPAAERLVAVLGWRPAVTALGLCLLVVGMATALFALPRSERRRDGSAPGPHTARPPWSAVLRDRRFLMYTAAITITFFVAQGVIAHRVARFEEVGFPLATVALWAAIASAMSLPGRWIAPMLALRYGTLRVQAGVILIVALGVLLMVDGTNTWQMIGHFSMFGLAFGAVLPLRALAMSDWYSGPVYGRIMGAQWTSAVLVGATGPALVGVLRDLTGDYRFAVAGLTGLLLVGTLATLWSGGESPQEPLRR